MLQIFLLVLAVFVPIVIGYALKRGAFVPDSFWAPAEKLTYYILLPALVINAIATGRLSDLDAWPMFLTVAGTLGAATVVLILARGVFGIAPGTFASIYHGVIRPNGYMGIATCLAVLGPDALPQVSIVIAVWIPAGLILAVYMFARSGSAAPGVRHAWGQVARNPLILSVFIGLFLNAVGAGPFLRDFSALEVIGRAALPIGLFAVGAGVDLAAARAAGRQVLATSAVSLIGLPALVAVLAWALKVEPIGAAALVLYAAMPTSSSGFIMAQRMNADAPLMAGLITFQTAVSIVTITAVAIFVAI
ncbi:MAG: AEC family transporter [Proteobacteria bacterium]|nr:AEC family transporter [Pseudomonadota bacterium]MDA1059682.1 AEC family transporter [Pseudomonadota bacterium]